VALNGLIAIIFAFVCVWLCLYVCVYVLVVMLFKGLIDKGKKNLEKIFIYHTNLYEGATTQSYGLRTGNSHCV